MKSPKQPNPPSQTDSQTTDKQTNKHGSFI